MAAADEKPEQREPERREPERREPERREPERREKVLGIGLPKTGLTSLLMIMSALGYRSLGRKNRISKLFYRRRYERILGIYDEYDFIVDHPTCLMYKLAFARYGRQARYILTLRRNPQVWFESLKRHQRYAHPIKHKHRKWFGRFYPHGFDAEHIAYYQAHRDEVLRFFEEKGALDRLLVICVEEPGSFGKLIDFLGEKTEMTEFPHENKSVARHFSVANAFKHRYNEFVQPLYGRIMPRLRPKTPRQVQPPEPSDPQR